MASVYGFFNGVIPCTAATTLTADQTGSLVTNRGASGSVTVTLPAITKGACFIFAVQAAQTFVIAAPDVDTLIAYNDAAADSVSSNTVGAIMFVFCDGTSWYCIGSTVGVTYTVNT